MIQKTHKAGFVHLIGNPNAGKSTLFNTLVNKPLSIVTHKAQTTREDVVGIANTLASQIIYVDTPGYIQQTKSPLQKAMVKSIQRSIPGADILLWVVDAREKVANIAWFDSFVQKTPTVLLLNKIDLMPSEQRATILEQWKKLPQLLHIIPISARDGTNLAKLREIIENNLPEHPAFYDKEDISDRPMQFFVAEIIRKVILLQYQKEIPYSTAVVVTSYKEEEAMIRIDATIYTERLSQKKILIGRKGLALQKLCIAVRQELSSFLEKKIFFKPYLKTLANWRKKPKILQKLGYL